MDDIIARYVRGEATPREIDELERWRAESPYNERQYREVAALHAAIRGAVHMDASPPPTAVDLLSRAKRRSERSIIRRPPFVPQWIPWTMAAAATVVLALQLSRRSEPAPTVVQREAAPAEVVTGTGELATVRMADGTVVRLAPRTRLRLINSAHERIVAVEGHAFFAVAKNPARPFRVRTNAGDLVALGTRFDVRSDSRELRLAVVEGRVALFTGGAKTEVGTGEASGVRDGIMIPVEKLRDAAEVTRWMRRFLAFQATPLMTVAMEIERVYGRRVVLSDASLGRETVTATFTDESLEQVIHVVCTVVGVNCAVANSQVTISR